MASAGSPNPRLQRTPSASPPSPLSRQPLGGRRILKFSCGVANSTSRRVCASRSHLTDGTIHLASRPGSRRLRPLVQNLADGQPKRGQCGLSPTKGRKMKSQPKAAGKAASKLISERIAELGDWRGDTLARMRALIREADPDVVEEWKWMGTPIWSHDGGICTGESYKSIVKLTFFKGASLKDPAKLFNSSLDGNARRAIDIHEGEEIDANAFKALIRAAVALNTSGGKKSTKRK